MLSEITKSYSIQNEMKVNSAVSNIKSLAINCKEWSESTDIDVDLHVGTRSFQIITISFSQEKRNELRKTLFAIYKQHKFAINKSK